MKLAEFNYEMERLKKTFGAVKYPQEKLTIFFERLEGIPITMFREQISNFISHRDKAPLLGDFTDAFAGMMADIKKQSIDKKLEGLNSCVACNDTGCEIFYERESGNSYAFQCSCKRGYLLCPTYPRQYSGILEKYASHRDWTSGKYNKPSFVSGKPKRIEGFVTVGGN